MKEFAKAFYGSPAWKQCRKAYAKSVGGLCERCLAAGVYSPGEIVHHKVVLTPENINNPKITLSFANLELVCRECHSKEHVHRERRWIIDDNGRVIPRDTPSLNES